MEEVDTLVVQGHDGAPARQPPRAMVVSSILLYREGLAASLAADSRLQVVSLASPENAISEALKLLPQIVLLDVNEKELGIARRLRAIDHNIILVGFGISNSANYAVACAEAGLAGFIDQDGTIDQLVHTALAALRGEFDCSPRVTALLIERLASLANGVSAGNKMEPALTPREREIASLVSEGLSNKEIALDLRIGPATVKNHVHNILDKLGVRRRAGIAARVSALHD